MGASRLALAVAVVCAGCQDYEFVFRENQRVGGRRYEVDVGVSEKTDILFVIDNSGSMQEEQDELNANMAEFIRVLSQSTNDYQVGLISTDTVRRPTAGDTSCQPCCDLDLDGDGLPDWTNCDDGRLYAADFQHRVFKRPALTALEEQSTADPTAELEARVQALIANFNATITSLGTSGTAFETPLEAMRRALDPSGDRVVQYLNRDFLRTDASLAVIFLTDEDDCSFPETWFADPLRDDTECYYDSDASAGTLVPNPNAIDPATYIDFLVGLKGSVEAVRAAAIIGGVQVAGAPDTELGFAPTGCYTIDDAADGTVGDPSAACGCWTGRYKTDTRAGKSGDFFCNMLNELFAQPAARQPQQPNNQGGCRALHASRVADFVDGILQRRLAAGYSRGVLVDSICRADYRDTLRNIASAVALSNCFFLKELPAVIDDVHVYRNDALLDRVTEGSGAAGWYYDSDRNGVCLEALDKEVGDTFQISVMSESRGF